MPGGAGLVRYVARRAQNQRTSAAHGRWSVSPPSGTRTGTQAAGVGAQLGVDGRDNLACGVPAVRCPCGELLVLGSAMTPGTVDCLRRHARLRHMGPRFSAHSERKVRGTPTTGPRRGASVRRGRFVCTGQMSLTPSGHKRSRPRGTRTHSPRIKRGRAWLAHRNPTSTAVNPRRTRLAAHEHDCGSASEGLGSFRRGVGGGVPEGLASQRLRGCNTSAVETRFTT